MSHLLDLASEPFGEIISHLETREWIALWICGNKSIQWRLSKGQAVRKMDLEWTQSSSCFWPSHIGELDGLEAFSLVHIDETVEKASSSHPPSKILHLGKLSKKLNKLAINCSSGPSALRELFSANPLYFPHLETLHIMFYLNDLDMVPIPSTVTSLRVSRSEIPVGPRVKLSDLPPGIIELECNGNDFEIDAPRFPPSLRRVKMDWFDDMPLAFFDILPPDIESLDLERASLINSLTLEYWIAISKFRNLKSLKFCVDGPIGLEEVQLIPSSVETLDLRKVNPMDEQQCIEILQILPPNLTKLGGILRGPIHPKVAKNLPRTLKQFTYTPPCMLNAVSYMPDGIELLHVWNRGADCDAVSKFPSKLTTLSLAEVSLLLLMKIPAELRSLAILDTRVVPSEKVIRILPKNLTLLELQFGTKSVKDLSLLLGALPLTMTKFTLLPGLLNPLIRPIPAPLDSSLRLPRYLKHLGMSLDFSESSLSEWILGLPNTLTVLALDLLELQKGAFSSMIHLHALKELSIDLLANQKQELAQLIEFGSLPRKLSHLSLKWAFSEGKPLYEETHFVNDALKGAPRSLTYLQLPESRMLTYGCLTHLPNIQTFELNYNTPLWFKKHED